MHRLFTPNIQTFKLINTFIIWKIRYKSVQLLCLSYNSVHSCKSIFYAQEGGSI